MLVGKLSVVSSQLHEDRGTLEWGRGRGKALKFAIFSALERCKLLSLMVLRFSTALNLSAS